MTGARLEEKEEAAGMVLGTKDRPVQGQPSGGWDLVMRTWQKRSRGARVAALGCL